MSEKRETANAAMQQAIPGLVADIAASSMVLFYLFHEYVALRATYS